MAQYIDKDALVAEIEKRIKGLKDCHADTVAGYAGEISGLKRLLSFLDTIEVKEVDEKFERPTINIEDDVSVASRLKYIDEDLKSITGFILKYASWNLHKNEWNQPTLEVPLFRVLDALVHRGAPYCESC